MIAFTVYIHQHPDGTFEAHATDMSEYSSFGMCVEKREIELPEPASTEAERQVLIRDKFNANIERERAESEKRVHDLRELYQKYIALPAE